jgi:hypothetical protein
MIILFEGSTVWLALLAATLVFYTGGNADAPLMSETFCD